MKSIQLVPNPGYPQGVGYPSHSTKGKIRAENIIASVEIERPQDTHVIDIER